MTSRVPFPSHPFLRQPMDLGEDDLHSLLVGLGTSVWSIVLRTMKEAPLAHTTHEAGTQVESPSSSDDEDVVTGSIHHFEANAPGSQTGPACYAPLCGFLQDHMGDLERLRRGAKRCGKPSRSLMGSARPHGHSQLHPRTK